jgi:hypothetical protein
MIGSLVRTREEQKRPSRTIFLVEGFVKQRKSVGLIGDLEGTTWTLNRWRTRGPLSLSGDRPTSTPAPYRRLRAHRPVPAGGNT